MNSFGLKLELLLLHFIAAVSTGKALSNREYRDPYSRSHYVPQESYLHRNNYQNVEREEQEELSTTEATKTFKIEVDVPQLIRSYLGLSDTQSRSEGKALDSQKFQIELKTPDMSQMWESFKNILRDSTDRRHEGAYVEEAPGAFKSPPEIYPKNFHEGNLLKLLKLKEKMTKKSRRDFEDYSHDPVILW